MDHFLNILYDYIYQTQTRESLLQGVCYEFYRMLQVGMRIMGLQITKIETKLQICKPKAEMPTSFK